MSATVIPGHIIKVSVDMGSFQSFLNWYKNVSIILKDLLNTIIVLMYISLCVYIFFHVFFFLLIYIF